MGYIYTMPKQKKDIVQTKNPRTGKYVKIDRSIGRILESKKSDGPYKGVPVLTQLGAPIPDKLIEIRQSLSTQLSILGFQSIDASSLVTGKDFLDKIWKIILGVPLGIAVLTPDMPERTIANIYYELGLMDALGKETLIIKSKGYSIPSDFKRTEYVNFDNKFSGSFEKFGQNLIEREEHYWLMAEIMEADPVLAIDYIKRAYLLNPKQKYKQEAKRIFMEKMDSIDDQSKIHIRNFISYKFQS